MTPHRVQIWIRRLPWLDWLKFLLVIAAVGWLLARGTERLGYNWQWYRVGHSLFAVTDGRFQPGPLLQGLGVTLAISGLGLLVALPAGLAAALLRLSDSTAGRWLATVYLESIRNTPLLIQLFFMYFVIATVLDIGRISSAVWSLGLFEGAYMSEIFRAGILSVPHGQLEAAYSLGLSQMQTYRRIILPQALRYVLPPLTSQAISLVKDSALVSTLAIADLTMQGQVVIAETFLTFEIWFTVAAIYLTLTLGLSALATALDRRLRPAQ